MNDDTLRDLAAHLPHDRPSVDRAERVRSSLLAAATQPAQPRPRRWLLVGGGFAAGALAAAAIAVLVLRSPAPAPSHEAYARIESSSAAAVEHTLGATASGGTDEVVRVRAGTLRLAVPAPRAGDRVRVATADAEIEGAGEYEVVVAGDALSRVTVTAGSATIRIAGKQEAVFLAAGQTWRAAIQTADLLAPSARDLAPPVPYGSGENGAPVDTSADASGASSATASGAPRIASPSGANGSSADPNAGSTANNGTASSRSPRVTSPAGATASPSSESSPSGVPAGSPRSGSSAGANAGSMANNETASSSANGASSDANGARSGSAVVPADGPTVAGAAASGSAQQLSTSAEPKAPVVKQASEIERRFRVGTALLRANKLAEAVDELGAAADAGDTPLAADARYFQAVALVKAKRGAEAERALVRFLDSAPTSIRRGRAAMMLGRLLADRGDAKTAREWFGVAASDPDPAVAIAAKAALAAR